MRAMRRDLDAGLLVELVIGILDTTLLGWLTTPLRRYAIYSPPFTSSETPLT